MKSRHEMDQCFQLARLEALVHSRTRATMDFDADSMSKIFKNGLVLPARASESTSPLWGAIDDGPLLQSDTSGVTGPFSNASGDGFQWGFRVKSLQKAKSLPKK